MDLLAEKIVTIAVMSIFGQRYSSSGQQACANGKSHDGPTIQHKASPCCVISSNQAGRYECPGGTFSWLIGDAAMTKQCTGTDGLSRRKRWRQYVNARTAARIFSAPPPPARHFFATRSPQA
jgi:hypothetical protein